RRVGWRRVQMCIEDGGNMKNGAMRAFQNFAAYACNSAGTAEQMLTAAFNSAGNALATFCTTGKLNLKSFTASLLADLEKIMALMSMMRADIRISSAFCWG
ncbi:phage tail tape measure C-terminal domain-containing protein, partial [Escherichia coli]|uniref:phage tail tape measure C-terminal domain-containing protein n=1 Tax=Escherichia coli TaxID=562 RepID=UPI001115A981